MKNIIIVLVDAFRQKNLSLYGYAKETDKNLKEIAKESIVFTNFYSTANATSPALTSMFTGLFQPNHGIIHQLPYTKQEEIDKVEKVKFWLPEFLKQNGYETIAIDWIRNWFVRGFEFYGENPSASGPFDSTKDVVDLAIFKIKQNIENNQNTENNQNAENVDEKIGGRKPFFMLAHCWDTHFPFPNVNYVSKANESDMESTLSQIRNEKQREYLRKRIQGKGLYTIQDMVDKYELTIQEFDKEIGRFVEFLKLKDLWKDTMFIVMGDHGTNIGEHEIYFAHSGLYEDALKIPFLIHIPGIDAKKVSGFAQHVDLVPTILDFIGLKPEDESTEKFDGVSLMPLIKDGVNVRKKMLFYDGLCEDIRAVRQGNIKTIFVKNNFCNLCKDKHHKELEMYDLEKDPEENNNILLEIL